MKEVYLYFRTQSTLEHDDDSAQSVMFPLSNLMGIVPTAADSLNIYFEPMINQSSIRFDHNGDSTSTVNSDYVVVNLSSNNTHKDVIARLMRLFSGAANGGIHQDGFIDVVDDVAGTSAVTGIAGPSGGTKKKPVGLIFIGIKKNNKINVRKYLFKNKGRTYIQKATVNECLRLILSILK